MYNMKQNIAYTNVHCKNFRRDQSVGSLLLLVGLVVEGCMSPTKQVEQDRAYALFLHTCFGEGEQRRKTKAMTKEKSNIHSKREAR